MSLLLKICQWILTLIRMKTRTRSLKHQPTGISLPLFQNSHLLFFYPTSFSLFSFFPGSRKDVLIFITVVSHQISNFQKDFLYIKLKRQSLLVTSAPASGVLVPYFHKSSLYFQPPYVHSIQKKRKGKANFH